jgi:hypothetical protein
VIVELAFKIVREPMERVHTETAILFTKEMAQRTPLYRFFCLATNIIGKLNTALKSMERFGNNCEGVFCPNERSDDSRQL